ncbi:hypothetical protein KR067_000604 [Drosophila pandora]|nr:hypothetical protein KR067_000604 [Drosophila pandora]
MSCLTSVLQLLQVLTTLSGCNFYQYVKGKRRPFEPNEKLHMKVGALHRFWLRPWLILKLFLHLPNLLLQFLWGLSDYSPNSSHSLDVTYKVGRAALMYQNLIITVAIYYNFRYRIDRLKHVLDEFSRMYHLYFQICGQKVKVNLFYTLFPTIRMIIASVPSDSVKLEDFGKLTFIMELSTFLFLCIQPFLLSMVATLGVLFIHGFYGIQHKTCPRKKFLLFSFYRNLIKLRQDFDHLLRPFVWAGLLECFIIFTGSFHMELYGQHSLYDFFMNLVLMSICPLSFFYVTISIRETERKFGRLRFNSKPQRQHQLFWLYRRVMFVAVDKNKLNIFRLNRKTLLEMLSVAWVLAMFTNSLMVNSKAGMKHFKSIIVKKI